VIIADIYYQKRWYSLIEFEMRKNESCTIVLTFNQGTGNISGYKLHVLLKNFAACKGVWSNISTYELGFDLLSMKHSFVTSQHFSCSIMERLKKLVF
tara:strand:+ start:1591 stop:1881 length:291 start_codon:yes stop_codon:yes gene_type:complete